MINEKLIKRALIVLAGFVIVGILIFFLSSLNFSVNNEFLINPQPIGTASISDKMKISLIKASQNLPAKSKLIKEKPRKNLPAINTPNSTNSDNAAEANNEEPEIEQVTPTKKPDQLYPDNPSEFDLPDDPPKSGR